MKVLYRGKMLAGSVRQMREDDVEAVAALQPACFPPPFPAELLWQPHHLLNHLRLFPEGQMVYVTQGEVVASASSLRIRRTVWEEHPDSGRTTGGLDLSGHDPEGRVLYGADISVHPDWRGRNIGRALYQARFDLVRQLDLPLYGTVCRLPDYEAWADGTPAQYAKQVANGSLQDRTMTPLLRMGLRFDKVIENYMDDPESGNAAAALVWWP